MKRKEFFNALLGTIFILFLTYIYYIVFVREFVSRKYMIWGDTYCHWSLKYMMLYSLKTFGELPWWDPTMYNGYSLYYHFLSGFSNYLSPFYLPSLVIFKILNSLSLLTVNQAILFHEAVYVIFLIVIVLYLISRELVSHNSPAAFLPPFLFCFSYFPLLNFHDFYSHEAMIAPLFYIWGLIRFNNRRTPKNLLLLLFLAGLLLASLCNGIMMSAFFWTTIFTFLLLVCNISLIKDVFIILGGFLKSGHGRVLVLLVFLIIIVGFSASYLPVYYNAGDTIVYRGGDVDYFSKSTFTNEPIPIEKSKIWTVLSNWLPFTRFNKERLGYGWDGHDHRYIGIITIPLILMALFYLPNRYVIPLLLTYLVCNTFIIYSTDNIVYRIFLDHSEFLRNVRNITSIFSRGGGHLFLLLLSGVGLDALMKRRDNETSSCQTHEQIHTQERLILSMEMLLFLIILGIGLIVYQLPLSTYETTFHIGWYLILFSSVCVGLLFAKNRFIVSSIIIGMFAMAFLDLTISSSAYIDTYARVPWNEGSIIPDNVEFKPIKHEHENMFPSGYHGTYHNTGGTIHWAKKAWLAFATTGNGRKILENWNPGSANMTEYPAFRFMDKSRYLPLESTESIQSILSSQYPVLYIHNEGFEGEEGQVSFIDGRYDIQKYTFNEILMNTTTSQDGYLYFLDNYDRFWNAYLNGKRTKIYQANLAFKAIKLPKGTNTIHWIYNPYPVRYAYRLFYFLLALFIVYYLLSSRTPKMKELCST